ncbi:MAG TPA: serine hydrolase domain-containing protein [Dongiaceae bacterium]|nr:serine hydrolase domain-containing protein [Dongiaceae bacterium]
MKDTAILLRSKASIVFMLLVLGGASAAAQSNSTVSAADSYLEHYVESGNFSGVVLVERRKEVVFQKAFGFADREGHIPNRVDTRFHIASMSMQFTAAAILRLADQGAIRLDEHVGEYVPGIEGADKITIRDLLLERSGLPDINAQPDYDDVLQHHQTAESLIVHIQGKPLQFEPGTRFVREEHSAYNLLALIIQKKTGLTFKDAMQRLVFEPFGLKHSGVDDDFVNVRKMAKGYAPEGTYGLKPAKPIHWSGKTGNASAFATAGDEALWVRELFHSEKLTATSREAILDTRMRVGYGWMRGENERFGRTAYYMNGRAPGFTSFVLYLPDGETTVAVLSNIYSSATTTIGYDIAAIFLALSYEQPRFATGAISAERLKSSTGEFQFGPDFYQANARVNVCAQGSELFLQWPSGDKSALIPLGGDRFLDRSYWEEVRFERGDAGQPIALVYDRFRGEVLH